MKKKSHHIKFPSLSYTQYLFLLLHNKSQQIYFISFLHITHLMGKYCFTLPSLMQRNVYLEKKVAALLKTNAQLKEEISKLLNSRNHDLSQMSLEPGQKSSTFFYFSYKEQIKQKLQEIQELEQKCSKIHYELLIKEQTKQVKENDGESQKMNQQFPEENERGMMRQNRVIQMGEDQNDDQINGRKMSKKESLLQKKEEKKAEQSGQTIPEVIVQPEKDDKEIQEPKKDQKPVQPPPISKVLKQTSCIDYIKSVFPAYIDPLASRKYGPISDRTKEIDMRKKDIRYSQNSFYLDHNFKKPRRNEFCKLNWEQFEQMRFCNSEFNTDDWKDFSQNAQQYPHLKFLLLNNNKIEEVKFQELEKLQQIKYINFENNPLSQNAKGELEKFKIKHKDDKIQVLYQQG